MRLSTQKIQFAVVIILFAAGIVISFKKLWFGGFICGFAGAMIILATVGLITARKAAKMFDKKIRDSITQITNKDNSAD
jgi:hypothetical protein